MLPGNPQEAVRIDKWLWCVRLFKTRNQASEACRAGKVKWEGQIVKPSRVVVPGDRFHVNVGWITKEIQVKALLHNRLSAKLVLDYLEDLTPKEEYERVELIKEMRNEYRDRGAGRPTKRERRDIDRLKSI